MMKQWSVMNDGMQKEMMVVEQKSVKLDAMCIQISKVVDENNYEMDYEHIRFGFKYIYEEIDNNDMVVYSHFIEERNAYKYLKINKKTMQSAGE